MEKLICWLTIHHYITYDSHFQQKILYRVCTWCGHRQEIHVWP